MTSRQGTGTAPPFDVVIPNLNRRFSGITSTLSAVVPLQAREFTLVSAGTPFTEAIPHLGIRQLPRKLRDNRQRTVIFHARRNNEMLLGLFLRKLEGPNLHLIFTSTAQRAHSRWTRSLYRRMDTLLSTSPRAASFLHRAPDQIIPHGIDVNTYHPSPDREREWAESGLPGRYGIGIFGRIRPQKGLGEFVRALCATLPKHPDFTAVIIGETTPRFEAFEKELKALIGQHGLSDRFVWLGKRPFGEIPGWFRRMSLVACVSRHEGFGLTCLEAMASGAAVVATQPGAFDMLVHEGEHGTIIPCNDSDSLAGAFDELLQNPDHLKALGLRARKHVEANFRIQDEANALNDLYRTILGTSDY